MANSSSLPGKAFNFCDVQSLFHFFESNRFGVGEFTRNALVGDKNTGNESRSSLPNFILLVGVTTGKCLQYPFCSFRLGGCCLRSTQQLLIFQLLLLNIPLPGPPVLVKCLLRRTPTQNLHLPPHYNHSLPVFLQIGQIKRRYQSQF